MKSSSTLKKALAWALVRSRALDLVGPRLNRGRAVLPVYHRVNDDGDPFFPSLPSRAFAEQLDYLAQNYRVRPLAEVVDWLRSGAEGPSRVAITIDDGYSDTVDVVLRLGQFDALSDRASHRLLGVARNDSHDNG